MIRIIHIKHISTQDNDSLKYTIDIITFFQIKAIVKSELSFAIELRYYSTYCTN